MQVQQPQERPRPRKDVPCRARRHGLHDVPKGHDRGPRHAHVRRRDFVQEGFKVGAGPYAARNVPVQRAALAGAYQTLEIRFP